MITSFLRIRNGLIRSTLQSYPICHSHVSDHTGVGMTNGGKILRLRI